MIRYFDDILKTQTLACSLLMAMLLSSCAKPYASKPAPHADMKATSAQVVTDKVNQQAIPSQFADALISSPVESATSLQKLMRSPQLDRVLARIKANDLGLRIQRKQLRFAKTLNDITQFDIAPTLSAELGGTVVSREEMDPVRQVNFKLSSRWEIDVWGIVRDQIRRDDVDVVLQKIALHDAEQSLMLKGIRAWLNASLQKALLDIAKDEVALQKTLTRTIRERVQAGLLDASEYESSKRRIDSLQNQLESQTRAVKTATRDLVQLSSLFRLDTLNADIPDNLPTLAPLNTDTTPLDVLTRRTDLKKAYWQLVKSDLNARIAYKDQFPRITLTASKSSSGKSLADLLDLSKISAQLASSIARQFIGGDQTVIKAEQEKLNADVQYLRYQQVILTAFHEVEQALSDYQDSETSITRAKLDLKNANIDEKRVREKFLAGLSDYVQQQSAQKAIFSAKRAVLQAQYQQLLRRVELAKVLGYAY